VVIPLLYLGLGLYIIINSSCFPWSIQEINHKLSTHPGKIIMSVVTTFLLVVIIGAMITVKRRKARRESGPQPPRDNSSADECLLEEIPSPTQIKD
jgi:large-conductance mechanosensitive channel